MSSTSTTPRTRDAERSREAILDAAEQLFAQNGYQGTSLQDVGDAAGVSRGTPSYFFGSKEGLYRAVLERSFAGVGEVIRREREKAIEEAAGPDAVFAREIEGYIDFLAQRPAFVRLLQWDTLAGGKVVEDLSARLDVHRASLRVISEETERGGFRDVDASHLLLNIAALCWFPFAQQHSLMKMLGRDAFDPEFVKAHKREVVRLVLDGIRSR